MVRWILAAWFAAMSSAAFATTYTLNGTINFGEYNFDSGNNGAEGPLRLGDQIRGTFDFTPTPLKYAGVTNEYYEDAALNGVFDVFRNGSKILAITQRQVVYANGNIPPQSTLNINNRDPRGFRDAYDLQFGGGDFDSGSVLALNPGNSAIQFTYLDVLLYEQCPVRNPVTNVCVNSPALDFYDGVNPAPYAGLQRYYDIAGIRQISVAFSYVNGDIADYAGTLKIGAIPEPSAWLMLVVSFGTIGAALRRRRPLIA